jgi:hypothetical protein
VSIAFTEWFAYSLHVCEVTFGPIPAGILEERRGHAPLFPNALGHAHRLLLTLGGATIPLCALLPEFS